MVQSAHMLGSTSITVQQFKYKFKEMSEEHHGQGSWDMGKCGREGGETPEFLVKEHR